MKNEKEKRHKRKSLFFAACIFTFAIGTIALFSSLMITKTFTSQTDRIITVPQNLSQNLPQNLPKSTATPALAPVQNTPAEETSKAQTQSATKKEPVEEIKNDTVEAVATFKKDEQDFKLIMPLNGEILKKFSMDKPLKSKTMGDFRTHNGIDIKTSIGTEVHAAADGVIEKIYTDYLLGVTIEIGHTENLKTQYSNLNGADMVKVGDEVTKGQTIACVGDTASGEKLDDAHLHFSAILNNEYVNPEDMMK